MINSIGCNIVHPECDKAEMYTREVYLERLAAYQQYGFHHVEFSHVLAIDEADAEVIRCRAQELGIVPWSIHSEHLNEPGRDGLEAYLRTQTHCARVARALGVKVCVCHVPNVPPWAADVRRDAEVLNRVADITDACQLRLAVETGPATAYVIEVVDRIGRPTVGINLDTGHTYLLKEDPAEAVRQIGRRLFTLHLQDNYGTNDDHQAPGMGNIEWRSVLRALKDVGYSGSLMVELTGEGVKARRATENLRTFPLEKEIVFTLAYLNHLRAEIG